MTSPVHEPHILLRLKKRAEFLRVAGIRRKWVTPGLLLQVAPSVAEKTPLENAAPVRLGFTVSRKVGNAVARNRAKRRLRAVAETIMPKCARPGFDYVIIGRRETVARPFSLLLKDLQTALKRLDVSQDAL